LVPRLLPAAVVAGSFLFLVLPASGQTWAGDRTTPALRELVAVDQTGEPSWIFGSEDVAGDGPAIFDAAERGADVRSAYAATDRQRLWLRVYVSAQQAPELLNTFVLIDTDNQENTGGSGIAPELDVTLDSDSGSTGYDVILAWPNRGSLTLWRWMQPNGRSRAGNYGQIGDIDALDADTETGTDLDPLRLNATRNGYVQASLNLEPLALSITCQARLLVRTTSGNTESGDRLRDRDVGRAGPCVPGDANNDDVSDLAVTDATCSADAQCPGARRCEGGRCTLPQASGSGGATPPGAEMAPGLAVATGEVVQGGAFTCSAAPAPRGPHGWGVTAALAALLGGCRWRGGRRSKRSAC
jgi:hypothetical protein